MSGYSNGTFKPEQKITREEFAVIAYNYMTYKGMSTLEGAAPYADEAKISSWARQAVDALAAAGYMKGGNYNETVRHPRGSRQRPLPHPDGRQGNDAEPGRPGSQGLQGHQRRLWFGQGLCR